MANKRIYGRKILRHGNHQLVDFIETVDLQEAKELGMAVDMNLDHHHYYSEAGYIMEKTYKKLMKTRPSVVESMC